MKKFCLLIILLLLAGCTVTKEVIKEVPVEIVKTEYRDIYHFDSIYLHDSSIVYMKGDTVWKEMYKYKYIEKQIHDTLETHDTIPQIINTETTVTKTVNKPQWWPVWLALGIVLLYLLVTKTSIIEKIKDFIKYIVKLFI